MSSHSCWGELREVCDLPLSQTGCRGCKNETFYMPILLIRLLFRFSESRCHWSQSCRHHGVFGWKGKGQNGPEPCQQKYGFQSTFLAKNNYREKFESELWKKCKQSTLQRRICLRKLTVMHAHTNYPSVAVLPILLNPRRIGTLLLKLQARGLGTPISWRSIWPRQNLCCSLLAKFLAFTAYVRRSLDLKISEEGLEDVEQTKLLDVHYLHTHLTWDQRVKKIVYYKR